MEYPIAPNRHRSFKQARRENLSAATQVSQMTSKCLHPLLLSIREFYKPEINPYIYSQLIFDKDAKITLGNDNLFNSDAGNTRYPCAEEWNLVFNLQKIIPKELTT